MSLVRCKVEDSVIEDENRIAVDSVQVTCSSCGNTSSSFGRGAKSIRRCFALLRDTCPSGETTNFYDEG